MNEEIYYYNNEPLQKSYLNDYTPLQKLEIVKNLEQDFDSGMLSVEQMRWIINGGKYGGYTCMRIIDKMMFEKKWKVNPITNDTRTNNTIRKPFDL